MIEVVSSSRRTRVRRSFMEWLRRRFVQGRWIWSSRSIGSARDGWNWLGREKPMPDNRVLIVEDSPTQLEAARAALAASDFDVHVARTGEEALIAVCSMRFDLVLSDVLMPGMSGFELCARIKKEVDDPPPVVLLTSLSDPRDIVRGVECG